MTLIKKGMALSDPNRPQNIKHTTPNEIMAETKKRKAKNYKRKTHKQFMSYEPGQFERIFKK